MRPTILLTFAQSPHHDYLAALHAEVEQLRVALRPATDSGAIQLIVHTDSRNENIPQLLAQHPDQISIFHFGGHADSDSLAAEDGSIFVEGLADQLAIQSQLKLVFLNGCQTQAQVQHFFRQGIPIVLATTCSIADGEASHFAAQFYLAIAGRHSIRDAFQLAVGALKAKYQQYREVELPQYSVMRDTLSFENHWEELPWQLYVQEGREDVLDWQLRYPHGLTRLPSLQLDTDCLGRETELEELRTLLRESSKVVLVSGLGGMGKTTLAAGYLQWLRNDYDHIAWINSGDDLLTSFAFNEDLAKNLELPILENENAEDRFARLMNKLRNQPGRNLLVIDDAGDQVSAIAAHLPSGANWQVLVTSRLPLPDFREMKLGVLQPGDALRLFRLHFQEGTDDEVQDLLIEISYHTLTIEVMAKTLNRLNGLLTVPELLVILRERKLDDPRLQELVWTRHAEEERAIFFHLMKAFELAKLSEEEIWLMQQYSVLPAIPIEVKILADLLQQEPLALNRQVNGLNDKGWIGKQGRGLSMHRMVQEVLKYQRTPKEDELKNLMGALTKKMEIDDLKNPVIETLPWLVYATSLSYNLELLNIETPLTYQFWNNLANVLGLSGQYGKAAELLEYVLEKDLQSSTTDDFNVATTRSNLAIIYKSLGRFDDAEKLLQLILEEPDTTVTTPQRIVFINNLATVFSSLGKYNQASSLMELVVESTIQFFGFQHPKVAIAQSNLALVYRALARYDEAKNLLESALTIVIEVVGAEHPSVSRTQSHLALVYKSLGDFLKAAELMDQALRLDQQNFGDQHPLVALRQSNLALIYKAMGQYPQARDLLEKALESDIANFGPYHPNVTRDQSNLATVLNEIGLNDRAAEFMELALMSEIANYGPDHPSVNTFQSNLGAILLELGQFDRAEDLLNLAIAGDQARFGLHHPKLTAHHSNLARVYLAQHKYPEAEKLLMFALENDLHYFGLNHPRVAVRYANLAQVYVQQQQWVPASHALEQAVAIGSQTFGTDHPKTRTFVEGLDWVNSQLT
ncbi:tetratricopeptide repeat protein [Haliscomenobacter hydrossis]|uniref:NB-ARC domain protein n=1 Tax=Haliscomenobacter hydrossis (strain ATCC 27775 / DSM 1100 / LMG 10767 / O) TaxID=760192 RepID=F4L824_HALH1|nr:tetratricopeptide repeat protein [Haliscomenobacter hydrossis]AEE54532.1 NB-ARC domain protein [Haliscomenobacter hydrossis DSM 1100]